MHGTGVHDVGVDNVGMHDMGMHSVGVSSIHICTSLAWAWIKHNVSYFTERVQIGVKTQQLSEPEVENFAKKWEKCASGLTENPRSLKELSHEIFVPVYWPVWIHLGLNTNRF